MLEELTGTLGFGDGGDEGHEAGAAEELGNKDGGACLSLWGADPLNALTKHAVFTATFSQNSTPIATHVDFFSLSTRHTKQKQK